MQWLNLHFFFFEEKKNIWAYVYLYAYFLADYSDLKTVTIFKINFSDKT